MRLPVPGEVARGAVGLAALRAGVHPAAAGPPRPGLRRGGGGQGALAPLLLFQCGTGVWWHMEDLCWQCWRHGMALVEMQPLLRGDPQVEPAGWKGALCDWLDLEGWILQG